MGYTLVQKGEEKDKSQLFTMGQTAKAVGLSRSTIMRMENRGLLKPAYVSPTTGNRCYDVYNVSRILHVQQLLEMGFTNEEALLYFSTGADAEELFTLVERRLKLLQRTYDEMKLRATNEKHLSVQLCRTGEGWYYVEHAKGGPPQDKYDVSYAAYHHCVEKGYRPSAEPLMVIDHRTDYLEGRIDPTPYDFDACIPIQPGGKSNETVFLPECAALMLYYCGDFSEVDEAYLLLGEAVHRRRLKPAGFLRVEAIVGPPIGREVDAGKYRCRLILPVEEPVDEAPA